MLCLRYVRPAVTRHKHPPPKNMFSSAYFYWMHIIQTYFKSSWIKVWWKALCYCKSSTAACPRLRWTRLQSSSFFFQFTELHLIWKMVHLSHYTHIPWAVSELFNFTKDRKCNESILSTTILLTRCSCVE